LKKAFIKEGFHNNEVLVEFYRNALCTASINYIERAKSTKMSSEIEKSEEIIKLKKQIAEHKYNELELLKQISDLRYEKESK